MIQVTSLAFKNNELIPVKYTCDGVDVNPPLSISGVPKKTKSLALIVTDPDSHLGDWIHWLVWNISPDVKEIEEYSVPQDAVEGMTNWEESGYNGPCPSVNTHRYFFKVVALDIEIDLDKTADIKQLSKAMENHILAEGKIMGRYKRK